MFAKLFKGSKPSAAPAPRPQVVPVQSLDLSVLSAAMRR